MAAAVGLAFAGVVDPDGDGTGRSGDDPRERPGEGGIVGHDVGHVVALPALAVGRRPGRGFGRTPRSLPLADRDQPAAGQRGQAVDPHRLTRPAGQRRLVDQGERDAVARAPASATGLPSGIRTVADDRPLGAGVGDPDDVDRPGPTEQLEVGGLLVERGVDERPRSRARVAMSAAGGPADRDQRARRAERGEVEQRPLAVVGPGLHRHGGPRRRAGFTRGGAPHGRRPLIAARGHGSDGDPAARRCGQIADLHGARRARPDRGHPPRPRRRRGR